METLVTSLHAHRHTPSSRRIPPGMVHDCIPHVDTTIGASCYSGYMKHPGWKESSAVREGAVVETKEGIPRHVNQKEVRILRLLFIGNMMFGCAFILISLIPYMCSCNVELYEQAFVPHLVVTERSLTMNIDRNGYISISSLVYIVMALQVIECIYSALNRFSCETQLLDYSNIVAYIHWSMICPTLTVVVLALDLKTEVYMCWLTWVVGFALCHSCNAYDMSVRPVSRYWMMLSIPTDLCCVEEGNHQPPTKFPETTQNQETDSIEARSTWNSWSRNQYTTLTPIIAMYICIVCVIKKSFTNALVAGLSCWYLHVCNYFVLLMYSILILDVMFKKLANQPSKYLLYTVGNQMLIRTCVLIICTTVMVIPATIPT